MKSAVDKKIIGFDFDGVIVDHTNNKMRAAKKFGISIKKNDTPSDVIINKIPHLLYEEFRNYLYDDLARKTTPDLMPGVRVVLNIINKNKIPFFLITRQKDPETVRKILKYYNLWPKYFNDKNTHFVREIEDKEIKAKELGITHYIDDERKVLESLASVKNKYLFDSLGVFPNSEYARVVSWEDIAKLI